MPNIDTATMARQIQGWGKARGDEWRVRTKREEARRLQAAKEAEEEERANEAREAATARDKVAVGEERSEKEMGVEGQDDVRDRRGHEEGGAGGAVAEETHGSDGHRTTGAPSLDTVAGSADPGTSAKQGADESKEVRAVEIKEVEGVQLGPAWDARDPS
jgi:hypothetical protein